MPVARHSLVMHNAEHLLNALGDELRFRRKGLGISQEELAHRAGVNRTYVAKLELAKNQPTLQILYKLSCKRSDNQNAYKIEDSMEKCQLHTVVTLFYADFWSQKERKVA